MFDSLRVREYRILWSYSFLTSLAMWSMLVGRAWLAYDLTGSTLWVGLVTFAGRLSFVLAPLGGILADRLDRRLLLSYCSFLSAAVAALLAGLAFAGVVEVWQVMLITLLLGVIRTPDRPASDALMAKAVKGETLLNAVALNRLARFGPQAIGPSIAAPLIVLAGEGAVFLVGAMFYLLTAVQVLRLRTEARGPSRSDEGVLKNLREGIAYAASVPALALLMVVVAIHCGFTMSFDSLFPAYSREVLGKGGAVFGFLSAGIGFGRVLGTLGMASLTNSGRQGRWFLLAAIFSGFAPILLVVTPTLASAFFATLIMGVGTEAFMTMSNTMILQVVPDGLRGRVSSLYLFMTQGLMAAANVLLALLADLWLLNLVFLVPALGYLALLAVISLSRPRMRTIYRRGSLVPAQPEPAPS